MRNPSDPFSLEVPELQKLIALNILVPAEGVRNDVSTGITARPSSARPKALDFAGI